MDPLCVTFKEAGQMLRMTEHRIVKLVEMGELPVVTSGERITRIPVAALERWVADNTHFRPASAVGESGRDDDDGVDEG